VIRFLIIGAIILAVVIFFRLWIPGGNPEATRRLLRWVAVGASGIAFVVWTLRGGLGAILSLLASLLPFLMSRRPSASGPAGWRGGPSDDQQSDIKTRFLHMSLDHATGVMRGTVLEGRFQGHPLDQLELAELLELLQECQAGEAQSARLLEAYLDRVYGEVWREHFTARESGADERRQTSQGVGKMTPEEAYQILGLEPGASEQEIKAAYRRLIQSLHPDRGGSSYLAAKVNQARDMLLGT
jgi:hypothetical protein